MIDPVVWFFLLGVLARRAGSDLRLPGSGSESLALFLLLAIALKGGAHIADSPLPSLLATASAGVALSLLLTGALFFGLHRLAKLGRLDAAAVAGHYGSVSVATFTAGTSELARLGLGYEPFLPAVLAVMEGPGLVMALLLAGGASASGNIRSGWWHDLIAGKTITALLGGLVIGAIVGEAGLATIKPVFYDAFKGILALYLLDLGTRAADQWGLLRGRWLLSAAVGVIVPLLSGLVALATAKLIGLSPGGQVLFAILVASGSYIAAPAVFRLARPEANTGFATALSLGLTFPFNVLVNLPLLVRLAG